MSHNYSTYVERIENRCRMIIHFKPITFTEYLICNQRSLGEVLEVKSLFGVYYLFCDKYNSDICNRGFCALNVLSINNAIDG